MKGKREFSEYGANQIRKLIEQKIIRNKIRGFRFYFSDFSSKKGYTVEELIRKGEIIITDKQNSNYSPLKNIPKNETQNKNPEKTEIENKDIEFELITDGDFRKISDLKNETLDSAGFYCIRLINNSNLPDRYQSILDKRDFKFIYIGKAEGENLRERLGQELEHTRSSTFFRSIGCVLKYSPMKGHLIGKSNQNNFKFSETHTFEIIEWLRLNVELSIITYKVNFNIENELIEKYCPLLNYTHNPLRLEELIDDKDNCRKIASE